LYDQAKYIDSRAVTSYTTACSFTLRKRQTIFLASLAAVLLWQTSSHILHYCTDAPSHKKEGKKERETWLELRSYALRNSHSYRTAMTFLHRAKTDNLARRLEPEGATC